MRLIIQRDDGEEILRYDPGNESLCPAVEDQPECLDLMRVALSFLEMLMPAHKELRESGQLPSKQTN